MAKITLVNRVDLGLLDRLWPEIEPFQKREIAAFGITDETYHVRLSPPYFNWMAFLDDVPVAVYGGITWGEDTIGIGLLTSYRVKAVPIPMTKLARDYMIVAQADHPNATIYCFPGEWEPRAIRWLELIGFTHTGQYQEGLNGDQLAIMIYTGFGLKRANKAEP